MGTLKGCNAILQRIIKGGGGGEIRKKGEKYIEKYCYRIGSRK